MSSPLRRSISIIIPAYNEDRRLPSTLEKIQQYLRQSSWDFAEIVVVLKARGEWALFSDADLSSPIEELDKLWSAAEREQAAVAIGSRALDRSLIGVRQPFFRDRVGRFFNLAMRLVTGLPFRDTQCGFKLFDAGAAQAIFSRQLLNGFGFDVEVLYIARRLRYKCVEVPVRWNDVVGTKVSFWRGIAAFLDPLKVRWNSLVGKY